MWRFIIYKCKCDWLSFFFKSTNEYGWLDLPSEGMNRLQSIPAISRRGRRVRLIFMFLFSFYSVCLNRRTEVWADHIYLYAMLRHIIVKTLIEAPLMVVWNDQTTDHRAMFVNKLVRGVFAHCVQVRSITIWPNVSINKKCIPFALWEIDR